MKPSEQMSMAANMMTRMVKRMQRKGATMSGNSEWTIWQSRCIVTMGFNVGGFECGNWVWVEFVEKC
jgi:hypothetical protein